MTHDAELIAALRKCSYCKSNGIFPIKPSIPGAEPWSCPFCRIARMAADRIEAKNRELAEANDLITKLRECGARSC